MRTDNPVRFQLRRTRGYKMPYGSIIVDRRCRWGNIFKVNGPYKRDEFPYHVYCMEGRQAGECLGKYKTKREAAQRAVDLFARYFDPSVVEPGTPLHDFRERYGWHGFQLAVVSRKVLRGKNLVCWCGPDDPCHADVILRVANS